MTNLGMIAVLQKRFDEARDWFDKAICINREVGDTWMVANCHNNLGNATRGLGDFAAARGHYAESLRIYREYDDRWALAFLLEDVGILAALTGDAVASLELVGAADAIREAIGAPRAPSLCRGSRTANRGWRRSVARRSEEQGARAAAYSIRARRSIEP